MESNFSQFNFRQFIESEFYKNTEDYRASFPGSDTFKIDLHCHDCNSDTPDELLGRLLEIPETWLETSELVNALKDNGADAITITNHNNARSCYALKEKGIDLLVGAEFTCYVPDVSIGIHVLAYGFDPDQEKKLNSKRSNLYQFLKYAKKENIPTIWAHPLYYYSGNTKRTIDFFERISLLFERFETINGQRNAWQNVLTHRWVTSLTKEKIKQLAKKHKIDPEEYCIHPYRKSMSGGSDSHMGVFPALTGTLIHVPDLKEALRTRSRSELALEAIREGRIAPYGTPNESERLTVAFLDYFCQMALHMQDPGLIRILLHKGDPRSKMIAFGIGNLFSELKRHKVTMRFMNMLHLAFTGTAPGSVQQFLISKEYRNIFERTRDLALVRKNEPEKLSAHYLDRFISGSFNELNALFFKRLNAKLSPVLNDPSLSSEKLETFIQKLELPIDYRRYFEPKQKEKGVPDLSEFFDGLTFPLFTSAVLYGAVFAGSKVMNHSRPFLHSLSGNLKFKTPPGKVLWITDTFSDKNGVAVSLQALHREIKEKNLPIDLLVCGDDIEPDEHLRVLKPAFQFTLPFYKQQPIRIPNFLELHTLFSEQGYDRIVAATEGPMGLFSILLKKAFHVPAYFYLHTDWITFMKKSLNFDIHMINRVRRILRLFYRQFDGHFVLNSDQKNWLGGREMGLDKKEIHLTGHWVPEHFAPRKVSRKEIFGIPEDQKVLLFVGRISREKGIMDLPYIYAKVKKKHPDIRIAVVGSGPAEAELKEAIPDLIHIGWVKSETLPDIYSAADLLLLPSHFDTFGLVVLEAMACGLPVAAYAKMGPKDIIEHEKSGYVADSKKQLTAHILSFFESSAGIAKMKKQAVKRAKGYSADTILSDLLKQIALSVK